ARLLQVPTSDSRLGGEQENIDFWEQHQTLLKEAWKQWADEEFQDNSSRRDEWTLLGQAEHLLNKTLYERVQQVWNDPTPEKEQAVKDLFQEVSPGVFVLPQFFTPQGIRALREHHLDKISSSSTNIPTRRPNGMNRFGLVLDSDVEGGVSYEELDLFREWLVNTLVRPIARSMFPEYTNNENNNLPNDDVSYAFTVHYSHDGSSNGDDDVDEDNDGTSMKQQPADYHEDRYLPKHTDASLYTFNINLNFEEEDDPNNPAQLVFVNDDESNNTTTLTMKPGMAVLHRGMHAHQALPLKKTTGTTKPRRRDQLIIWLFGRDQGEYYVRAKPYETEEQMTVTERWSSLEPSSDNEDDDEGAPKPTTGNDFPTDWL
ncbi:MAG: hypothetical protein SGARI_001943, partial [Bacillariaceae sp.]